MKSPNYRKKSKDNNFNKQKKSQKTDLEIYIGKNYKYIESQPISLCALLFGPFYLLYRKIYSESIIVILLFLVTSTFLSSNIDILIKIAINFVIAISFKRLYLINITKKLKQIRENNSDKSKDEITKIIEESGSTLSLKKIIPIIILYIGIIAIMNNRDINKAIIDDGKQINNNSIEQISYSLPPNTKVKENTKTYQYYTYKDNNESCYIIISTNHSNKYSTTEEYLVDKKQTYKDTSIIEDEIINKINWKKLKIDSDSKKEDYVIKYNNIIYEISYKSTSSKNTCKYPKEYIMNSIKLN